MAPPVYQFENSAASAYLFDPHDPRYYECCCCAKLHVSAVAKAVAIICIVSNVLVIWGAILEGTGVKPISWVLFGSGVMAVAVFQEHRMTLILLLVIQGLSIAAAVVGLAILFFIIFIAKSNTMEFREMGPLVYAVGAFTCVIMFWSFAVMLHFYSFLTDRERAGAVAVMYESRPPQQPSTVTTGPYRGYREQQNNGKRPSHDGHIPYPIYPVHRTPSITPAPSPIPAAPVVVTVDHSSPTAHDPLDSQDNEKD
ncbi:hypothetical protein PRIPAC_78307 [Pristionchus pacificus]|uniref:Uncharacterized protein n=1 Tax=Pristionchus pacificus TaxID=54126 RepID=A0A2A6CMK9_PRIPA|nr:hypothetical protein PRIPAC_78307 [Pristionchus pacificus]|eukprot:PDM79338.1 hypothetical protein PRIPAC_31917 [Pristionchus pacificus]